MQTIVYVDVDDTLIRCVGTKRIPVPRVIAAVRELRSAGAVLYLWSAGGAEYARSTAVELGISDCFEACLSKPTIVLDDQPIHEWRGIVYLHPNEDITAPLSQLRSPKPTPPPKL